MNTLETICLIDTIGEVQKKKIEAEHEETMEALGIIAQMANDEHEKEMEELDIKRKDKEMKRDIEKRQIEHEHDEKIRKQTA